MSKLNIINEIKQYIDNCGGSYSSWYLGISNDAKYRLFVGHKVNENTDNWIYRIAINSDVAREIEEYFIEHIGTDGGTGGGDDSTNMVYAYKKNSHTNP